MPKARVKDITMHYEVHGEGFPLIMIMGLSANSDWWDLRMIQELSEKFKLITFDNRGAGRTDISEKEYTVQLFADDTISLMDALGITKAHVLGISMGGMIAEELAINYPGRVEKLILCSTTCGGAKSVPPPLKVMDILAVDRSVLSQEENVRMMIPLFFTEDFIQENPSFVKLAVQQILKAPISNESYMRQLSAVMRFDAYDRLPQVETPTLVLHGKQDILVPPENASILAEAIPNAKLIYLEKSAHGLVEEMEDAIEALQDFLGGRA